MRIGSYFIPIMGWMCLGSSPVVAYPVSVTMQLTNVQESINGGAFQPAGDITGSATLTFDSTVTSSTVYGGYPTTGQSETVTEYGNDNYVGGITISLPAPFFSTGMGAVDTGYFNDFNVESSTQLLASGVVPYDFYLDSSGNLIYSVEYAIISINDYAAPLNDGGTDFQIMDTNQLANLLYGAAAYGGPFTAYGAGPGFGITVGVTDDIETSSGSSQVALSADGVITEVSVPEPASLALCGFPLLALALWRRATRDA